MSYECFRVCLHQMCNIFSKVGVKLSHYSSNSPSPTPLPNPCSKQSGFVYLGWLWCVWYKEPWVSLDHQGAPSPQIWKFNFLIPPMTHENRLQYILIILLCFKKSGIWLNNISHFLLSECYELLQIVCYEICILQDQYRVKSVVDRTEN